MLLFRVYVLVERSSFKLLTLIGTGLFDINLSVPLVLEYEEVLKRELNNLFITESEISQLIDYYCSIGIHHEIFFLWRPYLTDHKDDMVLELVVKARASHIITYNQRDFQNIGKFGLKAITPKEFLQSIGVIQ